MTVLPEFRWRQIDAAARLLLQLLLVVATCCPAASVVVVSDDAAVSARAAVAADWPPSQLSAELSPPLSPLSLAAPTSERGEEKIKLNHRRRRRHHRQHHQHQHRRLHRRQQGEQIKRSEQLELANNASNPLIEWAATTERISGRARDERGPRGAATEAKSRLSLAAAEKVETQEEQEDFCLQQDDCQDNDDSEEEEEDDYDDDYNEATEHPANGGGSQDGSICASNGRLYGSLCQLKRHSCRRSPEGRLELRPRRFCRQKGAASQGEEECAGELYARFKWLLWRKWRANLAEMFRRLDLNADGRIQAHELWPREASDDEAAKIAWAAHLGGCRHPQQTSCWFRHDFPFQPAFPRSRNPCSLSHLMLFEVRPPRSSLTFDALKLAFREQLALDVSQPSEPTGPLRVALQLGQSVRLHCPPELASLDADTEDAEDAEEATTDTRCSWSRYNASLPANEPHLSLPAASAAAAANRDFSLHLSDAQLHLSGPFACSCQSAREANNNSATQSERLYYVEVSGAPRVEVRPRFQWALAGSRVAFHCRHDHISTAPANSNTNTNNSQPAEAQVSWLRGNSSELGADRQRAELGGLLELGPLKANDSATYACRVEAGGQVGRDEAQLLVEEPGKLGGAAKVSSLKVEQTRLWVFHDNGISVYRAQEPEEPEEEMAVERELSGHQQVSAEVDGNWNQLTLCGGLNPEQVVICEWSDNALLLQGQDNQSYVYVGQPNLNRVLVLEASRLELVAIVNTEPQPRRLYHHQPGRPRLAKWAQRRRLTPAQWRQWRAQDEHHLIQHDIWLLCYGQPLAVASPTSSELAIAKTGRVEDAEDEAEAQLASVSASANQKPPDSPRRPHQQLDATAAAKYAGWRKPPRFRRHPVAPFSPRLGAWRDYLPIGQASDSAAAAAATITKEGRLRNRKSVHIIQATFFSSLEKNGSSQSSPVAQFKAASLLTTHHAGARWWPPLAPSKQQQRFQRRDLVEELYVPPRPHSMAREPRYKSPARAYVVHYDQRQLQAVDMETLLYGRQIDLNDCDPLHLVASAQGSLIVQCRSPISHQLVGQLQLDQLTGAQVAFERQVRAQQQHLSPDHRYLISVHTEAAANNNITHNQQQQQQRQSTIYVQRVGSGPLKLEYEIKTSSLEVVECAFVWRDGYYAAILVSLNKRDEQSELLSLRLVDGRLELMARVPGLINASGRHHKDQLVVAAELGLAALSTSRGSYVVDLEDNRVSQSLRRHQSLPTLLWATTSL